MKHECLKCGGATDPRKKYCSKSCQYWYNSIRKDKERYLPPFKKRSNRYFSMVTGYGRAKSQSRQGKRVNGMVTGSMAAFVNVTIEEWAELTTENIERHFNSISFYTPTGIRLGDGQFIKKEDINDFVLNNNAK